MKRLIIIMLAIGLSPAIAQDTESNHKEKRSPEERAEKMTQKMTEKLELTEEQSAKISEINKGAAVKMKTIHDEHKEANDEFREKRKEIAEETEDAILELLTEEQKEKFFEIKAERKMRMKMRHKKQHPQCPKKEE